MRFAEVVDSIDSLKEFMEINKIIPNEIIVVWDEDIEQAESEPKALKGVKPEFTNPKKRGKTKRYSINYDKINKSVQHDIQKGDER